MKNPRPPVPLPPRCRVMFINQRNYALRSRKDQPMGNPAIRTFIVVSADGTVGPKTELPPPRFHCVPDGDNVAICGAWPHGDAAFRARNRALGLVGKLHPKRRKHWSLADRGEVVTCPYCLSIIRKALRPKLKRRPPPRDEFEHLHDAEEPNWSDPDYGI